MTKARKVEILYRIAKGQGSDASRDELQEIRQYKVNAGENVNFVTRANIANYVAAVDNGYHFSFYDWCANNLRGDRRRKGGSAKEIAATNSMQSRATVFMGWLVWGIAIYWMFGGGVSVGVCAIIGGVVAFVLQKCFRRWAMFTLFILPIVVAAVCAQ